MWFRWHEGTTKDPKFGTVASRTGQSIAIVLAVWATLLEHASEQSEGSRGDIAGYDCEDIDELLRIEPGTTAAIFKAFENKGMIEDGRIARWSKRQTKKEDEGAAQRKRDQREREKAEQEMQSQDATPCHESNNDVTDGHAMSRDITTDKNRTDKKVKELKTYCANSDSEPRDSGAENQPDPPNHDFEAEFEEFWDAYGHKRDRTPTLKKWHELRKKKRIPHSDLLNAARNYHHECAENGTFMKNGSTFLGPQEPWRDYVEAPELVDLADPYAHLRLGPGSEFRKGTPEEIAAHEERKQRLRKLRDEGFMGNIDNPGDIEAWERSKVPLAVGEG